MSMEPPQAIDPNFRIELPSFEGPLDLLLHLCRKHELDILDLPIAFVTDKYLQYIGMMKRLNLDVASEYLVMAAELARIKSKMLLPSSDEQDEEEEEEEQDPRADLIRRLLEFQKYKRAGEELGARGVAGRDVFFRGTPAPEAEGPAPLADVSVFKLLDALQKVFQRAKADLSFEVTAERVSIQDRIQQITDTLRDKRSCRFVELFEGATATYDIVVTFLAILEMAKVRVLRVYQPDPKAEIYLEYRVLDADATEEGTVDGTGDETRASSSAAGGGGSEDGTGDETWAQPAAAAGEPQTPDAPGGPPPSNGAVGPATAAPQDDAAPEDDAAQQPLDLEHDNVQHPAPAPAPPAGDEDEPSR